MLPEIIYDLRRALHTCPEISGREHKTKALLQEFLKKHTKLELHPCGEGFYAACRAEKPAQPGIALRADYDALPTADGNAAHLCGHDGHAAALCGAALLIDMLPRSEKPERDVFFLFQPAEETGAGAPACLELFEKENISEIYGAHNLPGWELGLITTKPGTFACASRGLTLNYNGKPTHAAYPEDGISPATAVGRLLSALPVLSAAESYSGMTLCTVIGCQMGEKAFGAAAANAEIWLTLRAEHDDDLTDLQNRILAFSTRLAEEHQLEFAFSEQDIFPATENTPEYVQKVLATCGGEMLAQPMRWSEDFGHYLQKCQGAFFGIGAGKDHPQLHTAEYEYPNELLEPTVQAFIKLIKA